MIGDITGDGPVQVAIWPVGAARGRNGPAPKGATLPPNRWTDWHDHQAIRQ